MQSTCLRALILSLTLSAACFYTTPLVAADPAADDRQWSGLTSAEFASRWQGFYAGINLDAVGTVGKIDRGAGIRNYDSNQAGAMIGVHAGYNFAPLGNYKNGGWLFGTEVDASFGRFSSNKTDRILGKVELDGHFLASARLRGGFAWESVYLYGTAGVAATNIEIKPARGKSDDIRAGLALGIGAEYAFSDNWTARLEAVGYHFGDREHRFSGTRRTVDFDMAKIRFGLSRRF